ncbi:MAG: VacB/RNase II family 3'-5' exoribonuclease, partial [Pseudomonadota bacterium]|nr:VacB/RNase II family 3'-5' exoribonuclease [Pseudomonadota bacterium]
MARLSFTGDDTYIARAIKFLGPDMRQLLGVFERDDRGKGILRPADRRQKYPYPVLPDHEGGAQPGEYVVAEPLGAGRNQKARVIKLIGNVDDPKSISLVAIHTHGLPVEFPPEALAQAERAEPAELEEREDLRSIPLVTIDGADARDFDDAVFAEPDVDGQNDGGWRIIVAIADVAWYVRHNDDLDRAARERGNSAYFPDRVLPMLPEKLSNDLCSLRPGEDRACLAADMRIDATGNLLSHRFTRGLMRSAARLTYDQVQAARDGATDDKTRPLIAGVIEPLFGAYTSLSKARDNRGTLDLDIPERQVLFREEGWIDRIVPRVRYDSHRLIEEFMIAANVAAAEALHAKKTPVMYRVHEQPSMGDVETLRESLAALGFKLARAGTLRPSHFAGLLAQAAKTDKLQIVSDLILRAQSKAVYSPDEKGHFGLALRRYCHFTSPIRRYADLLVHRALIGTMKLGDGGLPNEAEETFVEVGEQISATERRAAAAERNALERFTSAYLADRVGSTFSGRISGV